MPYHFNVWCDGACRNNGRVNPRKPVVGGYGVYAPRAPKGGPRNISVALNTSAVASDKSTATSNRAELHGLIGALELALKIRDLLDNNPYFICHVKMDSQYVTRAMTEWIYKWSNNGWKTTKGLPVANQDLIRRADSLIDKIEEHGDVRITHISRTDNQEADDLANDGCDLALELWH